MNVNTGILPYLFKTYRARDSYHWLTTYLSAMLPNTTAPVNTPNMYAVWATAPIHLLSHTRFHYTETKRAKKRLIW